jgi:Cdc6-like AAA superfamily ATPase
METPDILNSKIKKLRIELPDYHFSHSASGDSQQKFIGRERILEKLKRIVVDSPDEPGVYMVTGNRGVGKTSLVCEVIKETSLRTESNFFDSLKCLFDIKKYKKNHNRLYLRINFGHKLRDEKDIFRLITRTLSTEYARYRRSFWRMLPWRGISFGILFLLACLFGSNIKSNESITHWESISGVFFNIDSNADFKVKAKVETAVDKKIGMTVETKVETTLGTMAVNILLKFDQLVKKIVILTYYRFWLPFLLAYLFFALLFRSTWITHFFVTHRIIVRRLRKLNSDITYSTERENLIRVNSGNAWPGISMRTKKSRNIADAREIEKELQNILDDMRRIPRIMCRPQVIIVFDELDKVEPGDSGSEKEAQQTKASMFSIGATRERQTEILRILSNMKYFLSTAHAKFIFIAGREMYDIFLADVSERNNYIGSIFNAVFHVSSFLTDHPTGKDSMREESSIASLTEEFVCRRLFPRDYKVELYNLKSYREYLEERMDASKEELQKIIAVLQQFVIYLAHISKGAPKKMMQLFESFVVIRVKNDKDKRGNTLVVQGNRKSKYFLSFSYYKQYTLGIIAYLMMPIFYRLSESNIKEYSDKLLVSTLRFVDFLFKFHKHSFSWKHLEISPEMIEVNHAPELKSVAMELLNYLSQVHINKSNFSLYDYKYDSWIANEIFTMTKTDDVFSALFSFSLDEMLPLKKQYQDLLEKNEKEYLKESKDDRTSVKYIDAISSLQIVLGDLCYYDDELEEAGVYYKNAVEMLRKEGGTKGMSPERLYLYARNKLKIGMIHEKRRQYDFAYKTYSELCEQIISGRANKDDISLPWYFKFISPDTYGMWSQKTTYEGLKMLYLPFIAKLQILEKSHIGGIGGNHLTLLEKEFEILTQNIKHEEVRFLEAEFYSRVADILYYKNSDLKLLDCNSDNNQNDDTKNNSCTACHYYHKALSTLLNSDKTKSKYDDSIIELLRKSIEQIHDNYNIQYCTILARILSDWGNVFFSCDNKKRNYKCYIYDAKDCNTQKSNYPCACYICGKSAVECTPQCACIICGINDCEVSSLCTVLKKYINYVNSGSKDNNRDALLTRLKTGNHFTKMEIAFAMYSISSKAYRRANQFKRAAYQMYKMFCLFKHYKIYNMEYIKQLSKKAIRFLWHANDDLTMFELNKVKKDFDKFGKDKNEAKIPLKNLLVDSEITKIRVLVKELELKSKLALESNSKLTAETLKTYYGLYITSPYRINYSIGGRIYRLRLKSIVNYEAYKLILGGIGRDIKFVVKEDRYRELEKNKCGNMAANEIFKQYFEDKGIKFDAITVLENIIAETIYCLVDIVQLAETMGETYVFTHSFFGSIHEHLSFWLRQYEEYERYKKGGSNIGKLLESYLDEEWRELLFAQRENRQALAHYHKCLEIHSGGRAYHTMIDTLCYVKDDYNDRSDHFNVAEERHLITNGTIKARIDNLKDIYKDSDLYNVENYFDRI